MKDIILSKPTVKYIHNTPKSKLYKDVLVLVYEEEKAYLVSKAKEQHISTSYALVQIIDYYCKHIEELAVEAPVVPGKPFVDVKIRMPEELLESFEKSIAILGVKRSKFLRLCVQAAMS